MGKAFALAIANAVLTAIALTLELHIRSFGVTLLLVACAFWPAVLIGYLLGNIAAATAAENPRARLAVLAVPACCVVVALGALAHRLDLVARACLPTLIAASILERTTRREPLVPRAAIKRRSPTCSTV